MEASAGDPSFQQKRNSGKKKQQVHNEDIVFTKNATIQTLPSLAKQLKTITVPVIGLQYVWEYRSPSKSVAPHYQCRLCKVQRLQSEMVAHVAGWKHYFKYIKHLHPERMPHEEDEVAKNQAVKKEVKVIAAEVEQTEGRGQVKVVIREPADVPAFQSMNTAFPKMSQGPHPSSLLGPIPGGFNTGRLFGSGGFMDPTFEEEFSPRGGMMPDFLGSLGDAPNRSPDRYAGLDRMMGGREHIPNSRSLRMGSDGFGMDPRSEDIDRCYTVDLPINSSDRMMRSKGPDSNNTLTTLLRCLDTFRIECEDDAQIVLKITQKLTDVLMEYRLRTISSGSSMNSSCLSLSSDRFSGSMSGPSRFYN